MRIARVKPRRVSLPLRGRATTLGVLLAAASAGAGAAFLVTPDSVPSMTQYEAVSRASPPGARGRVFRSGEVDINNDDRPDLIGHFTDACTLTGCEAFLLLATPYGYALRLIALPRVDVKVTVLDSTRLGMRDLRIDDARSLLRWDGKAYR
jgi:hypothetical protein